LYVYFTGLGASADSCTVTIDGTSTFLTLDYCRTVKNKDLLQIKINDNSTRLNTLSYLISLTGIDIYNDTIKTLELRIMDPSN